MALALAGCSSKETTQTSEPPAPRVVGETIIFATNAPQLSAIAVETVATRTLAVSHVTGRLYWDDDKTVRVFTPVAGRVVSVLADIEQSLKAGATLAEVDSPDFGQALAAARTAVGNFAAADRAYSRAKELLAHGSAASKDVEAAEAAFRAAQAERDRALAQLANYGGSIASTNSIYLLRSPIAGVLVEKNLNAGQELRPDMMLGNVPQTYNPLFTISDPTMLWLQLDVSETDLPSLQTGLPLHITSQAFPGKSFGGTLEKIGDSLDPATRTVKVRGVVSNPDKLLKAEMYVLVDVVQNADRAAGESLEVPSRALFLRDNDYCVFLEQSPGQYRRQKVKVGVEKDNKVPILEGVTAGQKVVSEGALLLQALLEPSS